jgi:hypothetical protein
VGKKADLVLVEGNPVLDIEAISGVKRVWVGGEEVDLNVSVPGQGWGSWLGGLWVTGLLMFYIVKGKVLRKL